MKSKLSFPIKWEELRDLIDQEIERKNIPYELVEVDWIDLTGYTTEPVIVLTKQGDKYGIQVS